MRRVQHHDRLMTQGVSRFYLVLWRNNRWPHVAHFMGWWGLWRFAREDHKDEARCWRMAVGFVGCGLWVSVLVSCCSSPRLETWSLSYATKWWYNKHVWRTWTGESAVYIPGLSGQVVLDWAECRYVANLSTSWPLVYFQGAGRVKTAACVDVICYICKMTISSYSYTNSWGLTWDTKLGLFNSSSNTVQTRRSRSLQHTLRQDIPQIIWFGKLRISNSLSIKKNVQKNKYCRKVIPR